MSNNRRKNEQGKVDRRKEMDKSIPFGQKRVKTIPVNPQKGGQKRVVRPPKNKGKNKS